MDFYEASYTIFTEIRSAITPLIGTPQAAVHTGNGADGTPTKYIDKIAEDQLFRQELAISVLPENYLPSKTEGSDEWKKHNWAKVNERWRGLVIARSRRECREHPVEIFIDKEKRLK